MSFPIARRVYAQMYGPTVGDRVRLADTELFIEIERDFTVYGDSEIRWRQSVARWYGTSAP